MKKSIALFMVIAILFTCVACRDNSKNSSAELNSTASTNSENCDIINAETNLTNSECQHLWSQWIKITPPSCDKEGIQIRKCEKCSIEERGTIEKLDHSESDWIIDIAATVGIPGSKHTECIYCKKQMKTETIPALDENHQHEGVEWITTKQPKCTTKGSKDYICSCGLVLETQSIDAIGHTPVTDQAVAATCDAIGLTEGSHCSVCGTVLVKQKTISAKGHNMATKTVAPSSGEPGYTLHYCTECTYAYKDNFQDLDTTTVDTVTPNLMSEELEYKSFNDGTCAVIGVIDTTLEDVVIPTQNNAGETVVEIYAQAFKQNDVIRSISVPTTVEKIGTFAFYGCKNLTTVTGTNYVTSIDAGAFKNCVSLTVLDISNAAVLGSNICSGCTSLTSVKLSDHLQQLPQNMFADCSNVLNVTLPSSITVICNGAFYAADIESIVIPDSVKKIEMYAFRYCSNLKSVKLSNNLEIICPLVFERCTALSDITLPEGLKVLGRCAFTNCESLTSINIPDSVTSIGDTCFWGCTSLTSVTLPADLSLISTRLFSGCKSLKTITLPTNLTDISSEAFNGTAIEELVIPSSCKSIGSSAFASCTLLNSIIFGTNLKSIGSYAFQCCYSLEMVTLPDGFESIGDHAFYNCSGLQKIYLGTSIKNIGNNAFYKCTGLTSVFLPRSLLVMSPESYDKSPFTGCSGTLDLYSNAQTSNTTWDKYFGRISYGVSYSEYVEIIG